MNTSVQRILLRVCLIWHSVGTGKTALALRVESRQWEPVGYAILWVTRSTIRKELFKTMFDDVAHYGVQQMLERGEAIPDSLDIARRTSESVQLLLL